ncbi:MAG: hypothetical protein HY290_02115 [Planctomycetia bacterium]|nr:hypothetical protein [Planctomycetia bacterium]
MIDQANVPDVGAEETLARYVVHSSHIRRSNQTLKPDTFIPHPYRDLSVTRHLLAIEEELWSVGEDVADASGKTLYGRGDIRVTVCTGQQLLVQAKPTSNNPNHADVTGWPADKPAQKIIAQEIAATAVFVAKG